VYYLLYADDSATPSKVATDPEEPFLGRIRADSVAPPHTPDSIKRCISRVECILLIHADLFAGISCDTPLKKGLIPILRTNGPGLSPDEPMAIVIQVESLILDGKYVIKNRAEDICWALVGGQSRKVYSWTTTLAQARAQDDEQVNELSLQFSNVQRIIFFQSGTLHMILMVTSS
jgi:hypothetical protein